MIEKKIMDYIKAFLFGLSLAISIGPIAILIVNQTVNCGLVNGLKSGLGAAMADCVYALAAFAGGYTIYDWLQEYNDFFRLISSLALIILGAKMAYNGSKKIKAPHHSRPAKRSMACNKPAAAVFGLTILNPLTIVAFAGLAGQYHELSVLKIVLLSASVFAGSLLIQLSLAFSGSRVSLILKSRKTLLYLDLASAFSIIGFGALPLLDRIV